jgi:hypothetical protein
VDGRFAQEAAPTGGASQDRPDEQIRWAFEHKPDALSGRGTLGRGARSAGGGPGPHEVGDFPLVLSLATLAIHEYTRTPKVRLPLPESLTALTAARSASRGCHRLGRRGNAAQIVLCFGTNTLMLTLLLGA